LKTESKLVEKTAERLVGFRRNGAEVEENVVIGNTGDDGRSATAELQEEFFGVQVCVPEGERAAPDAGTWSSATAYHTLDFDDCSGEMRGTERRRHGAAALLYGLDWSAQHA
jgi:hypothetical protein